MSLVRTVFGVLVLVVACAPQPAPQPVAVRRQSVFTVVHSTGVDVLLLAEKPADSKVRCASRCIATDACHGYTFHAGVCRLVGTSTGNDTSIVAVPPLYGMNRALNQKYMGPDECAIDSEWLQTDHVNSEGVRKTGKCICKGAQHGAFCQEHYKHQLSFEQEFLTSYAESALHMTVLDKHYFYMLNRAFVAVEDVGLNETRYVFSNIPKSAYRYNRLEKEFQFRKAFLPTNTPINGATFVYGGSRFVIIHNVVFNFNEVSGNLDFFMVLPGAPYHRYDYSYKTSLVTKADGEVFAATSVGFPNGTGVLLLYHMSVIGSEPAFTLSQPNYLIMTKVFDVDGALYVFTIANDEGNATLYGWKGHTFVEMLVFDMCPASHLDVTHFKGVTYLAIACKTLAKVFFYRWQYFFQLIQWVPAPQNTRPAFFTAGGTLFVWATVPNNTGSAFRRLEMIVQYGIEVPKFFIHEHDPIVGWQMYWFEQDGEVYIYLPRTTDASVPVDPPDMAHYVTYSTIYKWI